MPQTSRLGSHHLCFPRACTAAFEKCVLCFPGPWLCFLLLISLFLIQTMMSRLFQAVELKQQQLLPYHSRGRGLHTSDRGSLCRRTRTMLAVPSCCHTPAALPWGFKFAGSEQAFGGAHSGAPVVNVKCSPIYAPALGYGFGAANAALGEAPLYSAVCPPEGSRR